MHFLLWTMRLKEGRGKVAYAPPALGKGRAVSVHIIKGGLSSGCSHGGGRVAEQHWLKQSSRLTLSLLCPSRCLSHRHSKHGGKGGGRNRQFNSSRALPKDSCCCKPPAGRRRRRRGYSRWAAAMEGRSLPLARLLWLAGRALGSS